MTGICREKQHQILIGLLYYRMTTFFPSFSSALITMLATKFTTAVALILKVVMSLPGIGAQGDSRTKLSYDGATEGAWVEITIWMLPSLLISARTNPIESPMMSTTAKTTAAPIRIRRALIESRDSSLAFPDCKSSSLSLLRCPISDDNETGFPIPSSGPLGSLVTNSSEIINTLFASSCRPEAAETTDSPVKCGLIASSGRAPIPERSYPCPIWPWRKLDFIISMTLESPWTNS